MNFFIIKIPKTNPGTWYVNEKLLILVGCYISVESSWKNQSDSEAFWNVRWNINIKNPKLTSNMASEWTFF